MSDATPERFYELFAQSGVAQAVISLDGTIVAVNAATCALFDSSPADVLGRLIISQLPQQGRAEDESRLLDLLAGRVHALQFERRLPRRSGGHIDALVSLAAVRHGDEVAEISVCLQDITDLAAAQRAAEREQARWRSLSQNASDVALITDAELVVSYVSPALTLLLGYAEEDILGQTILTLIHPDDQARVAASMNRLAAENAPELSLRYRIRHREGDWRHVVQHVVNLLGDPDVLGLVANLRDETEQQRLQTTLLRAVLEDPLTGLPNRALVMDRVQQAIEREHSVGRQYSLLLVDVDGLKAINDAYGQAAGDQVLRQVADTLSALVGPADTVGRHTGGEFAVLLEDLAEHASAEAVAARIVTGLTMEVALDETTSVHVSACVGLAHGPADNAETLISQAEAATYDAKALGRARMHVLEQGQRDRIIERRVLGGELAAAISAEQLAVHYQPIVELTSGAVVGFEALVRWPHPRHGLIGPETFLPLADSLDLQVPLDEWVLREACRSAQTWAESSRVRASVAVNVAPSHLTSPGFAATVEAALKESGLAPDLLVLEVTETAVVADLDAAHQVLTSLVKAGVGVSIDDFGTGYSSMLQLRQLPFSKLKIDREFVRGLPQSEDDTAICASVISLAERLGVGSIAEGVEDPEQASVLSALGCQLGQGFLWSPAVDRDTAAGLLVDSPWVRPKASPRVATPAAPTAHEDPEVSAKAWDMNESGASLHTIAAGLNREGFRTRAGRRWTPASVARLLYRGA